MKCPYCLSSDTKVVDKRDLDEDNASRRRRECLKCGKRFTTYERVESIDLKVVKKDGSVERYEREKLRRGILISVQKRLSDEEVDGIVEEIELKMINRKSTEVSSSDIGRMVLARLKKKDLVGYLRFASIFIGFDDINSFKAEIKKLEKNRFDY